MAKKILHIITKLELGGAQKNVLSILSSLDRSEYEAHLISSDGLLGKEAALIPGLHLKLTPFLKRDLDIFCDIVTFFIIIYYIRKNKIGIVHTHSSKAGIIGRWAAHLAGVRMIIHTVHGWGFHEYLKSFLNSFYIFLEQKTAVITDKLIAVSDADIQNGLAHGIGEQKQYVLVRCGVDKAVAKDSGFYLSKKHSFSLTQEDKVVVMVACLKPQKNPLDFVIVAESVLGRCRSAKFLLVGDGILYNKVKNEIEKKGLDDSIFMLGWRKDVEDILPFCDVVALTSLWEGSPMVFLEAMYLAKPIVAYDICGAGEVVKDGVNGFLVPPGDVKEFSAKVSLLLENEGLRHRMGQFGLHIISQGDYSTRVMMDKINKLYGDSAEIEFA